MRHFEAHYQSNFSYDNSDENKFLGEKFLSNEQRETAHYTHSKSPTFEKAILSLLACIT